ncbi:hypothetical protein ACFP81_04080 [Deinococcus lacus]|uniref:MarR family transcriptional regulator n=1 Tax=Deinococcus lacus TaxID=392561 RepID=A0ABW1YCN9_9DEIO
MARVGLLRLILSFTVGLAAALLAAAAFYVRGDMGGVFQYLRARRELRELGAGASADQLAAARQHLSDIYAAVAAPELAVSLLPLAGLLGVVAAWLAWQAFGWAAQAQRPDLQERMVYRLAYRMGGQFTLSDLAAASPLTREQAGQVLARMQAAGQLQRDGETYRLT